MSNNYLNGSYIGQLPVGLSTTGTSIKGIFDTNAAFNRIKLRIWPAGLGARDVISGDSTYSVPPGATSLRFSIQGQNGSGSFGSGAYLVGTIPGPNIVPTYYVRFAGHGIGGNNDPEGANSGRRGGNYAALLTSPTISDPAIIMIAGGGGGGAGSAGGPGLGVPGSASNNSGGVGGNRPSYPGGDGANANVNDDESGDGGGGGGGGYRGGSGGASGHYGGEGNWNEGSSGGGGGSSYINPIVTNTQSLTTASIPTANPEFNSSNAALGGNIVYVYVTY